MVKFSDLLKHNAIIQETIREDLYRGLERSVHQAIRGSVSAEDKMSPVWESTALKIALLEIFLHEIKLPHKILTTTYRKSRQQRMEKLWSFFKEATPNSYVDVIKTISISPGTDQENCLAWIRKSLQQPECLRGEYTTVVLQLLQDLQADAVAAPPEPKKPDTRWEQPVNVKHRHHKKHKHHKHKNSRSSRASSASPFEETEDVFAEQADGKSTNIGANQENREVSENTITRVAVSSSAVDPKPATDIQVTPEPVTDTDALVQTVSDEVPTDIAGIQSTQEPVDNIEVTPEPSVDNVPEAQEVQTKKAAVREENDNDANVPEIQDSATEEHVPETEQAAEELPVATLSSVAKAPDIEAATQKEIMATDEKEPDVVRKEITLEDVIPADNTNQVIATSDDNVRNADNNSETVLTEEKCSSQDERPVDDVSANDSSISNAMDTSGVSHQSSEDFSRVFTKNLTDFEAMPKLNEAVRGNIPEGFEEEEEPSRFEEGLEEETDILIETEAWSLLKRVWKPSSHPPHWTSEDGTIVRDGLEVAPPVLWEWKDDDWEIVADDEEHDAQGWRYAQFGVLFETKFSATAKRMCHSRERRWKRTRIKTGVAQIKSIVETDQPNTRSSFDWKSWSGRADGAKGYEKFDITTGLARKVADVFGSLLGNDDDDDDEFVMVERFEEQEVLTLLGKIADIQTPEEPIPAFCAGCDNPLPLIDEDNSFVKLCFYDGKWYCTRCHTGKEWPIPAYILNKNNFQPHPVCDRNHTFLEKTQFEPVFNELLIRDHECNAELIEKTGKLTALRESIQSLFRVIERNNCDNFDLTEARKSLFPRDHLLLQTSSYSLQDLLEMDSSQEIKEGSSAGEKLMACLLQLQTHIETCRHCSGDEASTKM